jgi:hypothetical protein
MLARHFKWHDNVFRATLNGVKKVSEQEPSERYRIFHA